MNYPLYNPEGFALEIFQKKYALHEHETWEEACSRVASYVATAEQGSLREAWQGTFYEVLATNKFAPGGRIWYGAGRPRGQAMNCFALEAADSREGWGDAVRDMIIISGTGGGVGIYCGGIRPRGSKINGTGGYSTGSISLMEIMNAANSVIVAGGERRGALLFGLPICHGDIIEFLDKKLDLEKLTSANISVVFNDDPEDFFKKVKKDEEFELTFRGKALSRLKARDLWMKIITNSLKSGEPGILNGYLANRMSNMSWVNDLVTTNPCVTADTWISTDNGPRQVSSLVGKPFVASIHGELYPSAEGFWCTGEKEVFLLETKEGFTLKATSNHQILTSEGWTELKDLKTGDQVDISNQIERPLLAWEGSGTKEEGWLLGEIVGDGCFNPEARYLPQLCFWGENASYLSELAVKIIKNSYNPRSDFNGIKPNAEGKIVVASKVLEPLASRYIQPKTKEFLPSLESETSFSFICGFLSGFFDADGAVLVDNEKGSSVRLSQSSLTKLQAVQRMLLRYGIKSTIYQSRREACLRQLPDGKGGSKDYQCQADHELVISRNCIERFNMYIGFKDPSKQKKLEQIVLTRKRAPYKTNFSATVTSITKAGKELVYDCTVNDVHCFEANGIIAHNCGEVWLSVGESCCLGSLALPRFIMPSGNVDWEGLRRTVEVAVRFLDNVITVNNYPLPYIAETCKNLRRIGIGVMGLHDMLLLKGLRYSSDEGLEFVDKVMGFIKNEAYLASSRLAAEKGSFPFFETDKFLKSNFVKTLKPSIRSEIKANGIRGCGLLSIAPTGTISLVSGFTQGIESLYAPATLTRYRDTEGLKEKVVVHPLFKKYIQEGKDTSHFQGVYDLTLRDHFEMQRMCQKHLDNSCSKTICVRPGVSPDELSELYMEYIPELKGCTVYPEGSRENQPLTALSLDDAIKAAREGTDPGEALPGTCRLGGECG